MALKAAKTNQSLRSLKIRRYCKNFKNRWRQSLVPCILCRNKILVLVLKNYAKWEIKLFYSGPILLDFLTLFCKFCSRFINFLGKTLMGCTIHEICNSFPFTKFLKNIFKKHFYIFKKLNIFHLVVIKRYLSDELDVVRYSIFQWFWIR